MKKTSQKKTVARKRDASSVGFVIDEPLWRTDVGALRLIGRAVRLAFAADVSPVKIDKGSITILLTDDRRLRALNKNFRGRDHATNVLSFPAAAAQHQESYLGDIALGYGVIKKEARQQKKDFAAHAAHLAAHGLLHLLGYDHETTDDALVMEELEIRVLARLGIGNPYLSAAYAAAGKEA